MAPLNADSRERLVSPVGLALMLIVVLAVLWFLLPEQARFQTRRAMEKPDALSIAYLRAMLRGDPARDDLRLNLVRQLLALGELQEAAQRLAQKRPDRPDLAAQAQVLQAELILRRAIAAPSTTRPDLRETLLPQLQRLPVTPATQEDLARLPELALQAGLPALAAAIARRLAHQDGPRASEWWQRAGRWALAAGKPLAASADYAHAAESGKGGPELADRAIEAALAGGHPRQALDLARRFLARWPDTPALLARGVDVALQVGRIEDAARWNRRYLSLRPDDLTALRRQREIMLARGRLKAAARLARRIAMRPESTRADWRQLARILEWSGDPAAALDAWQRLADGRPASEQEIRRLARMLLDLDAEIASLRRQRQRTGQLPYNDLRRLAHLLERHGEPEQALAVLAKLLTRHPDDAQAWRLRLQLLVQSGRTEQALALLTERERRQGASDALRRQRMRIFWQALREEEAWREARHLRRPLVFHDPADAALQAELAWRHGDYALAERLYMRLYEWYAGHSVSPADAENGIQQRIRLIHERLIRLADEQDDVARASAVGLHGWRQLGDPDLLWLSLQVAARHDDHPAMERLLKLALNQPDSHGHLASAMLEMAAWKQRHGQPQEAETLYRQLLAREPRRLEARLGLLWLYVDTQRRARLWRHLLAWQQDALNDSRYWPVYAAGWTVLDQPARALPWIERRVRHTPGDPLWLLTWADTLDALGQRDSAWRVRRHALALGTGALHQHLLAGRKLDETDRALLHALRREIGLVRVEPVVAGLDPSQLDAVFLAGWYLSDERNARARTWLLRQQQARLARPAWQAISLALLDNDTTRIADLLEGGGLSVMDRVRGLTRLGRRDEALALALEQIRPETGFADRRAATIQAAELFQELPTFLSTALLGQHIGNLSMGGHELALRFSRGNVSLHFRQESGRLDIDPARYDLAGRNTERILAAGLAWQGRRQRLWFELGRNRRPDHSTPLARLGWGTRLPRQGELRVAAERGVRSEASEILRADGLKDEARMTWYQPLTGRTAFRFALGRRDFRSRSDQVLARGRFLDASLDEQLATGTHTLQIRLQGTWQRNDLASALPADMAARLPPGAVVADVLPADYAALGIGLSLARGAPLERPPQVGGLRYTFDGWFGPVWPERRIGYAVQAALGSRLFGSDELALSLTYSDVLNVIAGQTNTSLRLQYRYFFGR